MEQFVQHGNTSCLLHCVAVAHVSFAIARALHLRVREEALSRGAAFAVCNDVSAACAALIGRNAAALGFAGRLRVMQLDYRAAIERLAFEGERFDFAFLDAPYASGFGPDAAGLLFARGLMRPDGRVFVEHASDGVAAPVVGVMRPVRTRRFGRCAVTEMERDRE